jgi:hypothetical protein
MSLKCPVESCGRTFSKRSGYSQHVKLCIKKLELESNSDSDSDSTHSSSENNDNKVNYLISYLVLLDFKFLMNSLFRWNTNTKVQFKTCHLAVLIRKVIYYLKFQ